MKIEEQYIKLYYYMLSMGDEKSAEMYKQTYEKLTGKKVKLPKKRK